LEQFCTLNSLALLINAQWMTNPATMRKFEMKIWTRISNIIEVA
jgi:hypothetical protein